MELVQALSIDFTLVCFVNPKTGMATPIRTDGQGPNSYFVGEISLQESMEQYIQKWVHEDDRELLRHAVSLDTLKTELTEGKIYYANYRKCLGDEVIYFQMKAVNAGNSANGIGYVLGFRNVDAELRKEIEQNTLLETALSHGGRDNISIILCKIERTSGWPFSLKHRK